MKRYYDIDHDKYYTEDELRQDYETRKRNGEIDPVIYDKFEYYLNACLVENNGNLQKIASEWDIENKRRWTALKIARQSSYSYEQILPVLQEMDVHGNWTEEEILIRPVNIDELQEIVEERLEGNYV